MSEYSHNNPNKTRHPGRGHDYTWHYEYYDYDEPVSFEGLKAHRYSIVIGFWVGLAVFVIFMFFVLTLLTKTGAPHQENPEPCEKRHHLTRCAVDVGCGQDLDHHGRPSLAVEESRSLFHCYINEGEQGARGKQGSKAFSLDHNSLLAHGTMDGCRLDQDMNSMSHFNIPNFVNSEDSSALEDDDLLLCEQPVTLGSVTRHNSLHQIIH
ncbi:melanocortin-2 receptor accessory protein 2A [Amia ocellicauda]|uniref:melanocortin-2 receptor accessory protein 2A n=1 Tax=Amia ocellicauda TaxID=2972642 RepID=UPI0034646369